MDIPYDIAIVIRGVTVFVFVPYRHGTAVTVRHTQSHDEYMSEEKKKGEF